jgi:hypothetical protein
VQSDGPPVRLNLTESFANSDIMPTLTVSLSLQGVNEFQEIVWLFFSQQLQRGHRPGPWWNKKHQGLYNAFPVSRDIVEKYLKDKGYDVRGGQYGLSQDIKPVRGVFECFDWKLEDDEVKVTAVEK